MILSAKKIHTIRCFFEQTDVQDILSYDYPFPTNWCEYAAKLVEYETGLEAVAGTFGFNGPVHTVNVDYQRGKYFDITGDQFPQESRRIVAEPVDSSYFFHCEIQTQAHHDRFTQVRVISINFEHLSDEYSKYTQHLKAESVF